MCKQSRYSSVVDLKVESGELNSKNSQRNKKRKRKVVG